MNKKYNLVPAKVDAKADAKTVAPAAKSNYKKNELKELLIKSLKIIRENVNTFSDPYFYNQKMYEIINKVPDIKTIFKLCEYLITYPESKNDINNILIELYGVNYYKSHQLNILVSIKTSDYGSEEHYHYILEDINECMILYINNKNIYNII
jgi:hypothetical protein